MLLTANNQIKAAIIPLNRKQAFFTFGDWYITNLYSRNHTYQTNLFRETNTQCLTKVYLTDLVLLHLRSACALNVVLFSYYTYGKCMPDLYNISVNAALMSISIENIKIHHMLFQVHKTEIVSSVHFACPLLPHTMNFLHSVRRLIKSHKWQMVLMRSSGSKLPTMT